MSCGRNSASLFLVSAVLASGYFAILTQTCVIRHPFLGIPCRVSFLQALGGNHRVIHDRDGVDAVDCQQQPFVLVMQSKVVRRHVGFEYATILGRRHPISIELSCIHVFPCVVIAVDDIYHSPPTCGAPPEAFRPDISICSLPNICQPYLVATCRVDALLYTNEF